MTTNMTLNTKQLLFTIAFRDKDYKLINDPSIASLNAFYERTTTYNGEINIEELKLDFMNCSNVYPLFKEFGVSDNYINVILDKVKIPIVSVCEDVDEHYEYWKNNYNPNKEDCCNLRK
jgi:hypothetical protein